MARSSKQTTESPPPGARSSPRPLRAAGWLSLSILAVAASIGLFVWYGTPPPAASHVGRTLTAPPAPRVRAKPAVSAASAGDAPPSLRAEAVSPPLDAEAEWTSRLLDASLSFEERSRAAQELAILGSREAFDSLIAAIAEVPSSLGAAIAECLGQSTRPEALKLLQDLARHVDEAVCRGAIRGLARRGGAEVVPLLSSVLEDASARESLRKESAVALGKVEDPAAFQILSRVAMEVKGEELRQHVLEGLGSRSFEETEGFFREYLASPDTDGPAKSTALEALGDSSGEPAPLLLEYARNPDPALREAAALAMSSLDNPGDADAGLVSILLEEKNPDVRLRLYEALGNQEDFDVLSVHSIVEKEDRADARIAGLELLASACPSDFGAGIVDYFEAEAAPELESIALNGPDPAQRLRSVIALGKAGTPRARKALEAIVRLSPGSQAAKAARAALDR